MSKRGESKFYNWVHDPFSEELPYKKVVERKEKMKKYNKKRNVK